MYPVIWFFALGVIAGVAKSDLRMPPAIYDLLSMLLLLTIGLKGGVELAKSPFGGLVPQIAAVLQLGELTGRSSAEEAAERVHRHVFLIRHAAVATAKTQPQKLQQPLEIAIPHFAGGDCIATLELIDPEGLRLLVHGSASHSDTGAEQTGLPA